MALAQCNTRFKELNPGDHIHVHMQAIRSMCTDSHIYNVHENLVHCHELRFSEVVATAILQNLVIH